MSNRLSEQQRAYLSEMGIPVWREQGQPFVTERSAGTAQETTQHDSQSGRPIEVDGLDWQALQTTISSCSACELHQTRTQTVFGVGDPNANLMLIGEAPGADEDRAGQPFVGRAGQLLNEMLLAIGFKREQVFIANILKCRPPDNRDPRPDEAEACSGFLKRQIELIQPKLILCVGRISAQRLLQSDVAVGKLRGRIAPIPGIGVDCIVTYHPAYLLRSPEQKSKSWDDLIMAKKYLESTA